MQYPRWFPYPRCWLRVLISVVSIAIAGTVIQFPFLLFGGIAGILTSLTGDVAALLMIPIIGGAIAGSLFLHAHTRQLVMVVCKLVRREPISWSGNPPKLFWNESLVDYLTLVFGGLLAVIVVSVVPRAYVLREVFGITLMVVFTVYGHHVRYLVQQGFESKRKRKNNQANRSTLPRSKRPARSIPDSDRDLNELRWQERQRRGREQVSRSSPPPAAPPPSSSIDDELERLRRDMEDKNKP